MGVSWITYKNKKILYVDYRGCKDGSDSIPILHEAIKIEKESPGGLLLLQNYEGTYANDEFFKEIKILGKEVKDKLFKNALVGFNGVKKVLLSGYILFSGEKTIKTFNNEEEAKEWLVSI